MKSIKEKAKEYQEKIVANNPQAEAYDFESAFIEGAKYMNEKACEWLKDYCAHNSVYSTINDDFHFIEQFKKTIEE